MLRRRLNKIVLLLLISLLKTTSIISQNTSICIAETDTMVLITPQQLKTANLIFNEHQNFKIINTLQREQIEKYEILYKDELLIDSMYQCTIDDLTVDLEFYKESLNKVDKKLKRKSRIANILSGVSASLFIVVLCLL